MIAAGSEGQLDPDTRTSNSGPGWPRYAEWRFVLPLATGLALGLGLLGILRLIARPLALLLIAVTLAEALAPIVGKLERIIKRRIGAIAIVYIALAGLAIALGWLVIPPLVQQGSELLYRLPTIVQDLQRTSETLNAVWGINLAKIASMLPARIAGLAVGVPLATFSLVLDVFLIIFMSVYWLAGSRATSNFVLSLFAPAHRSKAADVLAEMGQSMGGYVRGAAINAVIMGVLAGIGLTLIGMPYPLVLGALTMLGEVVPIIGPVVVGLIVATLGLLESPTTALLALGLFTALQQIEGHLLTPNIMKRQTDLPQTLVLFAIVVGGALGGLVGILVSIPVAAALRVLVLRVIAPALRNSQNRRDAAK